MVLINPFSYDYFCYHTHGQGQICWEAMCYYFRGKKNQQLLAFRFLSILFPHHLWIKDDDSQLIKMMQTFHTWRWGIYFLCAYFCHSKIELTGNRAYKIGKNHNFFYIFVNKEILANFLKWAKSFGMMMRSIGHALRFIQWPVLPVFFQVLWDIRYYLCFKPLSHITKWHFN